jgi:hypothetical protein
MQWRSLTRRACPDRSDCDKSAVYGVFGQNLSAEKSLKLYSPIE